MFADDFRRPGLDGVAVKKRRGIFVPKGLEQVEGFHKIKGEFFKVNLCIEIEFCDDVLLFQNEVCRLEELLFKLKDILLQDRKAGCVIMSAKIDEELLILFEDGQKGKFGDRAGRAFSDPLFNRENKGRPVVLLRDSRREDGNDPWMPFFR